MNPKAVQYISQCFIKPENALAEEESSKQPIHLIAWELSVLFANYIQEGLLFAKPQALDDNNMGFKTVDFLNKLKSSLSLALVHFFPLIGRLRTSTTEDTASYVVYGDCSNSPGAKLIHAVVDMAISDILSPTYVPLIVQSFFDHHKALNHDGHGMPLLSVQVTELIDGIFIGCSMNHSIADETNSLYADPLASYISQYY